MKNQKNQKKHKTEILLDDQKISEHAEELLQKEYLRYPYRNNIRVVHAMAENGICHKIYWLADAWEQTECPVWDMRKQAAGITRESRVCRLCVTHYLDNTLLHPKPVYKEHQTVLYLCMDQIRPERLRFVCDAWETFQPEWLQSDAAAAELLLEYAQKGWLTGDFHFRYIEIINTCSDTLCQRLKDLTGCTVKKVWISAMFGYYAMENKSGTIELLEENVAAEESGGRAVFSTRQNLLMPVRFYKTDHMAVRTGTAGMMGSIPLRLDFKESRNSRFVSLKKGGRLCAGLFRRPVEFINGKVGRMIRQIQIIQKDEDVFAVYVGLYPAYAGWKDEIKKMFCEYLYVEELCRAEYRFSFFQGLLTKEGHFFINELERNQNGTE